MMKTAVLITPLISLAMLCTSPESIGAYTPEEEKDKLLDCLPGVYANLLKEQKPSERLDERFPITFDNSGGIYDFIQKIHGHPCFQDNPDPTLSLT